MPKTTRSKDGKRRMNLRVEHRLGRDELVNLLCAAAVKEGDWTEDFPERPSVAWVLGQARRLLWHSGSDAYDYWRDDIYDDDADEIEAWATEAVDRAFPELKG